MVFKASDYWFKMIFEIMIKDGDLRLLGDYFIIGLGGGFTTLHKYLESPVDVTGSGRIVKAFTGTYRGVKLSTIAIAGGGIYAEWILGLAYKKKAKAVIGVGWCGGLADFIEVGDIVIPVAAVRDEDTTKHYVCDSYPAVADFTLANTLYETLKELSANTGIRVHEGLLITTSSTLTENPEWGHEWASWRVLGVDCETSVVYTLATLAGIPAVNVLVVSDHVVKRKAAEETQLEEKMIKAYDLALKASYETLAKLSV